MIANSSDESPPPLPKLMKFRRPIEEPTMSVATLLVKVEDLIAMTFGTGETNVINFKMLQTILLILATQMRLLEQDVEIRFAEEDDILAKLKEAYEHPETAQPEKEASPEEDKGSISPTQETGKPGKDAKKGKGGKKGKTEEEEDEGKVKGKSEDEKSGKKGKKKKEGKAAKTADETTSMTSRTMSVTVGSTTQSERPSGTHIGSIEVVTASKFNLLETMVKDLLKRTGGVPLPTMPSNEDLLAELAKGTATLPDTMGAMQVNARVKAAEEGLTIMAGLLTQLAASGALPPEVADVIAQMQIDLQQLALGEQPEGSKTLIGRSVGINAPSGLSGTASVASAVSKMTGALSTAGHVTHPELLEAMQTLEQELMKTVEMLTYKAKQTADQAHLLVKTVSDKMDVAVRLDGRISYMNEMLSEYCAQLSGFDAGLTAQLNGYRDQMSQLRNELTVGILQLTSAGANSESAALMELRAGYDTVLGELEQNMTRHSAVVTLQKDLNDELRGLVENVELLREQKADRDEVADGLRDKANISRLKGLLRQTDFDRARAELDKRLSLSYEKFSKQELTWMTALKELTEITGDKASVTELLVLKEYTNKALNEHIEILRKLEYMLGEPKTAMLTRQLARNAQCGPCTAPALMEPYDARKGAPPRLPALRHRPLEEPCTTTPRPPPPEDYNKHVCKRWVGGSHTLLSEHVAREHASVPPGNVVPTKQYTGHGADGRLYHMEEELQPCVECNKVSPDVALSEDGGGDVAMPVGQN